MPRSYLDENVVEALAAALLALGYDAVTTNRLGNKGVKDPIQLLLAARMGRMGPRGWQIAVAQGTATGLLPGPVLRGHASLALHG